MKSSREQFEEWFPQMVEGMPENMVKVFDEMLFMAWHGRPAARRLRLFSLIVMTISQHGNIRMLLRSELKSREYP